MLYFRMRDCSVVRFRPSRAAAPFVPPTNLGIAASSPWKRVGKSMQRVIQDPIPFLIGFCLILLTVWVWRWFKRR